MTDELNLAQATVKYPCWLVNCWFEHPIVLDWSATRTVNLRESTFPGLEANDARIEGHLGLHGCRAQNIDLARARITGQLGLSSAHLTNPGGSALNADGLTVEGDMYCQEGFRAEGEIGLLGARITGQLDLSSAHLTNPGGSALNADGLTVEGDMYCREGFKAAGEIRLPGARITSQLDLSSAHLTNPGGSALNADGLTVEGDMYCQEGFRAEGEIGLLGARITGQLGFSSAHLTNPGGSALRCGEAEAGSLWLTEGFATKGSVDLNSMRVGTLFDSPASWPTELYLNELVYDDLEPDLPAKKRLRWLRRGGDEYLAQPYEQLAAYYRRQGHDEEARRVLLAKQRHHRRSRPLYARFWGYALDGLVGYGYRPGRGALWMLALWLLGSVYFAMNRPMPIKAGEHPHYQPVLYAADVLLPIINLGQESAFKHQGLAQWVAATMIVLGWLFATAVIASITRVLTRS
ncbi:hypothetical protein [Rhizohabitans arisaemae]|uniref:hypothetical protein n=1 Tax=Rhizohabitans arisaemae TaxID=2720610 RepID=UPI0024B0A885|nr:hypothetical protein [Rhizohabitans arisaemae]